MILNKNIKYYKQLKHKRESTHWALKEYMETRLEWSRTTFLSNITGI